MDEDRTTNAEFINTCRREFNAELLSALHDGKTLAAAKRKATKSLEGKLLKRVLYPALNIMITDLLKSAIANGTMVLPSAGITITDSQTSSSSARSSP